MRLLTRQPSHGGSVLDGGEGLDPFECPEAPEEHDLYTTCSK